MKNISEKELELILYNHALWLASGCKEGKRGDLREVNLRNSKELRVKLSERVLNEILLDGSDLSEVDLSYSQLRRASLKNTNLERADLSGINFRGAILDEANLTEAILLRTDLFNAKLKGAIVNNASFINANLTESDLSGVELSTLKCFFNCTIAKTILEEKVYILSNIVKRKDSLTYFPEKDVVFLGEYKKSVKDVMTSISERRCKYSIIELKQFQNILTFFKSFDTNQKSID